MARMFPNRVPQDLRADPARAAECTVYEALLERLPDQYRVFAWSSWLCRESNRGARPGEADFVVAHPDQGVFVLEVKGGRISRDGATGQWSSQDRSGHVHPLKRSPFEQARQQRYDLERKLQSDRAWPTDPVRFGYSVAFPDCSPLAGDLGLDAPSDITLYHDDLGQLDRRVERIANYWNDKEGRCRAPGEEGMRLVERALAKSFQLPQPLAPGIAEDRRAILELSESQFAVLDGLSRNTRVLVTGCAGSGKTLLALEKAKRLARDDGLRTLLTCFNRPLAEHLRASAGAIENLSVLNFHALCGDFAQRADLAIQDLRRDDLPNEFYRKELPRRLVDALAILPERFEAIVVDEGQDFSADDRAALELALADRAESVLYVFQDEIQGVYVDASPWPASGMVPFVLTQNIRNTKAIHSHLLKLAPDARMLAVGPEGVAPELIPASGPREEAKAVSRVLHQLVHEGRVKPGAVAVLTSTRSRIPDLVHDGRIGAYQVTDAQRPLEDRVLVESVTRFKGLERDVVVLAGLEPVDYVNFQAMLYVGASRAMTRLYVVGSDEVLARFRVS